MSSAPEFDPLSPAMMTDPYPIYAQLQQEHPIFWAEKMGAWVVTRYEDCHNILTDSEQFIRDRRRVSEQDTDDDASLQSIEAAKQAELRRLLISAIHIQDQEQIGRSVRASIDQTFAELAARPSFDWIFEVAAPLAGTITAELMGVAEPDPKHFKAIAESMARKFDEDLSDDAEEARRIAENFAAFGAIIDGWIDSDQTHGTIRTFLDRAAELGIPLPVVKNSVGLLFSGSYTTIFGTFGNVAFRLMDRPDVLEQLRDPGLMSTGTDELVRYDGPTWATGRVATRETEVRGVTIKKGDPLFLAVAAANRDPAQFPRPQEILLDRTPNRHLGFGWGPHSCVGSLFGHLAIRELVHALQDAPAPLRLIGTPVRLPVATVRAYASLPVTFQA
jgi:cytochrome P450